MAKHNKEGGIPKGVRSVMGWVLGLGIIAFLVLILVVIFGNLSGNLGFDRSTTSYINESGWVNGSEYTFVNAGVSQAGYVSVAVDEVFNQSTELVVPASEYTVNSGNGTIIWTGITVYDNANISYTVTFKDLPERQAEDVIGNYTASARNTSAQFPTVGTILGIAVLLMILIGILVFAIRRMMGVADAAGGGSGGGGGGGSGDLSGSKRSGNFGGSQDFG